MVLAYVLSLPYLILPMVGPSDFSCVPGSVAWYTSTEKVLWYQRFGNGTIPPFLNTGTEKYRGL